MIFRVFPGGGRFPFSVVELIPALIFCALGVIGTWGVERARPLLCFFVVYCVACIVAFAVPSQVGENIERIRFAALPIAMLMFSLRRWRPLWLSLPALLLATSWNVTPLAASFNHSRLEADSNRAYWQPAIGYLRAHLDPSYRVEAVDTAGHWAAVYLPEARIPLARGWYRQDDFPQNGAPVRKVRRACIHGLAPRPRRALRRADRRSARLQRTRRGGAAAERTLRADPRRGATATSPSSPCPSRSRWSPGRIRRA